MLFESRRRKPVSAMNIDECGKKTFIDRLEKLTVLLRWTMREREREHARARARARVSVCV